MAKEENQEPSESGSNLGGLALGAGGIGGAALLSALIGGGGAFKSKPGKTTTEMPPGKQATLAFLFDMLLSRLAQTGGVNPSFSQYLKTGMPQMPMPDPGAIEAFRNQIRQPGAFDSRTIEKPPRPSGFQDASQMVLAAGLLGRILGGDGGIGLGDVGSGAGKVAGAGKSIIDYILGLGSTGTGTGSPAIGGDPLLFNAQRQFGGQGPLRDLAGPSAADYGNAFGGSGGASGGGGFRFF